jgi:hypothetical protein
MENVLPGFETSTNPRRPRKHCKFYPSIWSAIFRLLILSIVAPPPTLPTRGCSDCPLRYAVVSTTTLLAAVPSISTPIPTIINSPIVRLHKTVRRHCFNAALNKSASLGTHQIGVPSRMRTARIPRVVRRPDHARYRCTCYKCVGKSTTRRPSSPSRKHHSTSSWSTSIVAKG